MGGLSKYGKIGSLAVFAAAAGVALFRHLTTGKKDALPRRKVIIDTDTGADDASALILAAKSRELSILGVTVLAGNVDLEQATQNALAALETAGSSASVYRGSAQTYGGEKIDAFSVFGEDGMGDMELVHPIGSAQEKDAIDFIIDTVKANPGEVEIISLGPATNIAFALDRDPEAMKNVKMIWSMGTAGLGPGNASPVAEFNVYSDPKAYKRMLDSGLPVTVIGLDVCGGDAMWTDKQFAKLLISGEIGEFVTDSFSKLRAFYASNGSEGSVMNCDSMAMMCAIDSGFVRSTVKCHGSCITSPGETFGQVIFYREGFTYDAVSNDQEHNVTLVTEVDASGYFDRYLKRITV